MKTILLFFLFTAVKPCLAQDSTSIPQQLLQKPVQKTIFLEQVNANQNIVIMYLRAASRKKTLDHFFNRRAASSKTLPVVCCQISNTFVRIDQAWLHYHYNTETTHTTIDKISNVAGDLLDTFLSQYSIQNKPNY